MLLEAVTAQSTCKHTHHGVDTNTPQRKHRKRGKIYMNTCTRTRAHTDTRTHTHARTHTVSYRTLEVGELSVKAVALEG